MRRKDLGKHRRPDKQQEVENGFPAASVILQPGITYAIQDFQSYPSVLS